MTTHFRGPLLGSYEAGGGLYKDLPLGAIDRVRSSYQVWVEPFTEEFAAAQATLMGATPNDLNVATAPSETVTSENGYLHINPGTKADAGTSLAFDKRPVATGLGHTSFNTPGLITSTAIAMDNRELVWGCRFALITDDADGAWEGKALLGWFTTDATPMVDATGLPSIATGGGAGFHIGEDGLMTFVGGQTAITAVGSTTVFEFNAGVGAHVVTTVAIPSTQWHEVGFRIKWLDASAGTGSITYYHNGLKVGVISSDLPMASTQGYSSVLAIQNGPTLLSDLAVDYMITAITGQGR